MGPGKRKSADHWTLFGRIVFRILVFCIKSNWKASQSRFMSFCGQTKTQKTTMSRAMFSSPPTPYLADIGIAWITSFRLPYCKRIPTKRKLTALQISFVNRVANGKGRGAVGRGEGGGGALNTYAQAQAPHVFFIPAFCEEGLNFVFEYERA